MKVLRGAAKDACCQFRKFRHHVSLLRSYAAIVVLVLAACRNRLVLIVVTWLGQASLFRSRFVLLHLFSLAPVCWHAFSQRGHLRYLCFVLGVAIHSFGLQRRQSSGRSSKNARVAAILDVRPLDNFDSSSTPLADLAQASAGDVAW